MLKNSKQSSNLTLQSYKIDNSYLQTKINELQQLKSELKSTICRSKEDHSTLVSQIQKLRQQNQILKNEITKLQFTKKSHATLINQLQKKLELTQTNFYDSQIKLKQEQTKRIQNQKNFQLKFKQFLVDKNKIVNHYEQQLFRISKVVQVNEGGVVKEIMTKTFPKQQSQSSKSQPRQSIKVKRIKKASVQSIPIYQFRSIDNQKNWNYNSQNQDLTSEDLYFEMIRKVYKQLCKIEIKSKDIMNIPIIGSFSQLKSPTNNDVQRFFSNYPFSIEDKQKINLIHEFLVKYFEKKGQHPTGKEIIREIASSLQEIQGEKEISFASETSQATYLNESSMSLTIKNDGFRRISKPQVNNAYQNIVGMSKATIEEQQSMQSGSIGFK